jgi:Domain of unknown function (DUF1841)
MLLLMSEAARKAFACPPAAGVVDDIDLARLDPNDEDQRRLLVEAEHPDLKQALDNGLNEVRSGGDVMSPRLHILMHEIVTNQLWADDPPEVWQTAKRLTGAGYERHNVIHMLGSVVSGQIWEAMANQVPYDIERTRAELAALPGSWEDLRHKWPEERSRTRSRRRAEGRRRKPKP